MKLCKLCILFVLTVSILHSTYAATKGLYVGAGGGYGNLSTMDDTTKEGNGGAGGLVFVGYTFNTVFGLEASYRKFSTTTYKIDGYSNLTVDYNLSAYALALKAYAPFRAKSPFDFYAMLGLGRVHGKGDVIYYNYNLISKSNTIITGLVGLGFSYAISPRFTTEIEWSGMGGTSGDENTIGIPVSNLFTLNLVAKLV